MDIEEALEILEGVKEWWKVSSHEECAAASEFGN